MDLRRPEKPRDGCNALGAAALAEISVPPAVALSLARRVGDLLGLRACALFGPPNPKRQFPFRINICIPIWISDITAISDVGFVSVFELFKTE
jgi:hypothetical protein